MVITIDGLSVNGKTTLARLLSEKTGFKCLYTGSYYRALTLYALENNLDMEDIDNVLPELEEQQVLIDGKSVFLNGRDVTKRIRKEDVSFYSAKWANIKKFKAYINEIQQNFIKDNNTVVEGRDVGTRIAPNAEIKFYLYADLEARVQRVKELKPNETEEEIRENLRARDEYDINGGNFIKPENAFEIDTTNMTLDEVLNEMLDIVKKYGHNQVLKRTEN